MDIASISDISREAIYTLLYISSPLLIIALAIGLIISLIQALTQIQETTLTFVPKIIVVYLSMLFVLPFMYGKLSVFTDHVIQMIIK